MALVDRRTGSVVLRIVYDGPPQAGKTTNLLRLCARIPARREAMESHGRDERTQFFDWLDARGGQGPGHLVRCQLVAVPGQIRLARRRRYLLESADAVVVVADARAGREPEARAALRSLRRALAAQPAPAPLILQANKQDLPGALAPEVLRAALGLEQEVIALRAQATAGVGVVETFSAAARLAADSARAAIEAGALPVGDAAGAAELLAALEVEIADDVAAVEAP
jgi:hypothetical protein